MVKVVDFCELPVTVKYLESTWFFLWKFSYLLEKLQKLAVKGKVTGCELGWFLCLRPTNNQMTTLGNP